MKDHARRLSESESSILLLKSLGGGSSGSSGGDGQAGFVDVLENLVDKLRKECEQKYAHKDELLKLKKKVDALEDLLKHEVRGVYTEIENQGNSLA
jgi:hypothetical protein